MYYREGDEERASQENRRPFAKPRNRCRRETTEEFATHLNSETSLDVALSLVVLPDDSELDDSLGDLDNLEGLLVLGVLLEELREGKSSKGGKSQPVGREMAASRERENGAGVWRRTGARVEVSSLRA